MNPLRLLAVAPSFLPSLVLSLGLVTGGTFGAGVLLANALGDYLPTDSRPSTEADCSSGRCPAMLPCGVPLLVPGGGLPVRE